MQYRKYTIQTTEEAEDLIGAMLTELGVEGIEIEDKVPVSAEDSGGLYGTVVPEMPENDHLADISFYIESDKDDTELLQNVREELEEMRAYCDIGAGTISVMTTEDLDWLNNWKEFFHAFAIGDLLIEPTWESNPMMESEAKQILRIDPGTAFGTGKHETTKMVIEAIQKHIRKGDRFLDIGTGSGILGIVALMWGASFSFGTDLDPNVVPAIEDNMIQNGINSDAFHYAIGDIVSDAKLQEQAEVGTYDIVAANILAEILVGITPAVPAFLKEKGLYITSGILSDREQIVIDAAKAAGLTLLEGDRQGEWSCLVFQKN